MLADVTQLAKKERRTKSELVREALRRYLEDREWKAIRAYGAARALGITEADVDRLIHEHRREKRKKSSRLRSTG